MKRPLRRSEVSVGGVLPGDVYDERGVLLLRRGHVVASSWQLEMLLRKSVLIEEGDGGARGDEEFITGGSPLAMVLMARQLLRALFRHPPTTGFPEEILDIVGMLTRACQLSAEVTLAAILMRREGSYAARHAVNTAIACLVAGMALKMDVAELAVTAAAALTMNIGMADLQDRLQAHAGRLNEEQQFEVQTHCARGVEILRGHGVEDPLWLETVLDHHERVDGSGYPAGKQGDTLGRSARLLGLADIYCARVSSRDCRPAMSPTMAMRWLFLGEGAVVDKALATLFIKTLGVYPPGTGVRLKSGSLAVVTHRGAFGHQPRVASVTTGDGARLDRPIRRSHEGGASAIAEVVDLAALEMEPSMALLWGSDAAL